MAGEVGVLAALGQYEKAAALRDEAQPRGALGPGPTELAGAWTTVLRGTGPAEQGELAAVVRDLDLAQRFADERSNVQVGAQLLIKAGALCLAGSGAAGRGARRASLAVSLDPLRSGAGRGMTRQKNRSSLYATNRGYDRR